MRPFASAGARLWNLPVDGKVAYSCFCVMSLLGLLSALLLYREIAGTTGLGERGRITAYYGDDKTGGAAAGRATEPAGGAQGGPAAGPAIDVAPDEPPTTLTVAMPYRKLLEVSHFHLFTMPVFLLIISHLFMMTGIARWARLLWIALGWGGALFHLAAPWLIRYVGAGCSVLYPVSGALLLVSGVCMALLPVILMWTRPRTARPEGVGR